jgi:CDP-diacylglycerol--serine O-phosphatidyltransferase
MAMNEQDPSDSKTQTSNSNTSAASSFDSIVDEHVEDVSENGQIVRRKGIYILPNLCTTAALFAGFYAVIAGMRGDFENAAVAIFCAMVLDGLDGRIARMTNTSSKFGAEYDSLSDMVSFGVAPALVMFAWALDDLGKFGWSMAFIYVACAALRLARFNTQLDLADKNYFTGLASPAAAGILASMVWVCQDFELVGENLPVELAVFVGLITAITGCLMVANFQYYSFKGIDFRARVPFVAIILLVFVFGVITLDPPLVLLVVFTVYALSGPVMAVFKRVKKGSES